MKFGDSLYQRSIPEWAINNIDYNELKYSIKVLTTNDTSRAQPIPNSTFESEEAQISQDRLFRDLEIQYDRVNDFVQVKAGELSRRLTDLDKQVKRVSAEYAFKRRNGQSGKWAERFARLDANLEKVGGEIQSLSRFARTNTLAFHKLLKKYGKWTGSRALGDRFRGTVMNRPSSFSKRDFGTLLAQFQDTLEVLRAAHIIAARPTAINSKPDSPLRHAKSPMRVNSKVSCPSATSLHGLSQHGSSMALDEALATTPLGDRGLRATYWVHQDNIMNLQILLLRHASRRKPEEDISSDSKSTSSKSSPRGSTSGFSAKDYDPSEIVNYSLIVCDDLQMFAQRRNGETVSDVEKSPGTASERAAASIRLSRTDNALIAINTRVESQNGTDGSRSRNPFIFTNVSKRALGDLFDTSDANQDPSTNPPKASRAVTWFRTNDNCKPLVQVSSYRRHFEGLGNSSEGGLWITLDNKVSMRRCSGFQVGADKTSLNLSKISKKDAQPFPHAVLEIRVEGNASKQIKNALDQSDLVERVRGFSLETHAVSVVCKPPALSPPYWIPLLTKDIRKIPVLEVQLKERGMKTRVAEKEASTRHNSLSAPSTQQGVSSGGFSGTGGESSVTSVPEVSDTYPASESPPNKKKRRRSKPEVSRRQHLQSKHPPRQQRYWNEFDDGSEGEQEGEYVIYVDPNASSGLPSVATLISFFSAVSDKTKASRDKVAAWMRPNKFTDVEREPLTNGLQFSPEDSDLSDDETSTVVPDSRRYSTFPPPASQKRQPDYDREIVLFRSCISAFAASVILLFVAIALLYAGSRNAATEVDVGVVVGVSAALVFTFIGIASMLARRDLLGWMHRTVVLLIGLCVLIVSVTLLVATT